MQEAEKSFREKAGFFFLAAIGVYCIISLLILLRNLIEPFLWAMFLTVGLLLPCVDILHGVILKIFCCQKGKLNIQHEDSVASEALSKLDLMNPMQGEDPPSARELPTLSDSAPNTPPKTPAPRRAGFKENAARIMSIITILSACVAAAIGLAFVLHSSFETVRANWPIYELGIKNITRDIQNFLGVVFAKVSSKTINDFSRKTLSNLQEWAYAFVGDFVSNLSHLVIMFLMTMLYIMFWLLSPMPSRSGVDQVFRRYMFFKSLCCAGYGFSVWILLSLLDVDLAVVFGIITFVLNYVPEVGPFISAVMPLPMIILDSRLEKPLVTALAAVAGQLGLKFIFGNMIEVALIDSDRKLRMHPIIILLSVAFFGFIWGATGMLLSVPLMAWVKLMVMSGHVPPNYRDPILVILEGDLDAPLRHRGDGNFLSPKHHAY